MPFADDDPFTRAALRTRQSVRPNGGRTEGPATYVLDNYAPHVLEGLATLPQRAFDAADRYTTTGELDPGPGIEVATLMFGAPKPKNALGATGARPPRLPMDRASRMERMRQQSYADEPFYRGERTGDLPNEYPDGAYFSRDKSYADAFAQRGGEPESREFRLDLSKAMKDYEPVTAEQYGRIVASAVKHDPELAAGLVEMLVSGGKVEPFLAFAKKNPNLVVARSGALVRQMVGQSSKPEAVLKGAGFDALDSGRDVRKLTGQGIRLESAAFDPARRRHRNITRSIFGGGAALPFLLDPDPNRD
jgi:hypothetical protein